LSRLASTTPAICRDAVTSLATSAFTRSPGLATNCGSSARDFHAWRR
jgi:hypothetical protein